MALEGRRNFQHEENQEGPLHPGGRVRDHVGGREERVVGKGRFGGMGRVRVDVSWGFGWRNRCLNPWLSDWRIDSKVRGFLF